MFILATINVVNPAQRHLMLLLFSVSGLWVSLPYSPAKQMFPKDIQILTINLTPSQLELAREIRSKDAR